MLFEEFDNKVKDAANSHHPAYQEDAWEKMEELLDEHMPVKEKKRRRFIFWWLLPIAIGASFGIYKLLGDKKSANNKTAEHTSAVEIKRYTPENEKVNQAPIGVTGNKSLQNTPSNITETNSNNTKISAPIVIKNKNLKRITNTYSNTKNVFKSHSSNYQKEKIILIKKEQITKKPLKDNSKINNDLKETDIKTVNDKTISPATITNTNQIESEITLTDKKIDSNTTITKSEITDEKKSEHEQIQTPEIKKQTKGKSNSLFITTSLGPNFSFVSKNKIGETKTVAGVGAGFTFNNKFTIRAGFYSSLKIYAANGASYKGSGNFYQYYPFLENVEANCRIYEIPVAISYNFYTKKNQTLFISTALSSVIMKRETYDYYYRYTPTGNLYNKSWQYDNENKHTFSTLTLSTGFQQNLSKRFFVIAEPYYQFPLRGIGAGKVKLNSAGLQFTAGFKIF